LTVYFLSSFLAVVVDII